VVYYNGSAFIAILGGTNQTPPTLPTSSNTYWQLFTQGINANTGNVVVDTFNGTGSQTAFTLTGSPAAANVVDVYVSGVYQNKSTYTVSGTTLTFSSAPPSGTGNIQVVYSTGVLAIGTPSDGTVTTVKIVDGAITSAKIADGTIATADIADSAITSAKIADGTIVNADINVSAAIDKTKISGTAITAADTGTVTGTMIADGTITGTDIANSTIAVGKLSATGTPSSSTYLRGDNTWASVASGGLTLLATLTTTSGTTQVASSLPTTYANILLVVNGVGNSTSPDNLMIEASVNNGSSWGTAKSINALHSPNYGVFTIGMANIATTTHPCSPTASGQSIQQTFYIATTAAAAINALRFSWISGYTFNAGTIQVYGWN
jgi:hypothetical protein